jgi:hypothetical protein
MGTTGNIREYVRPGQEFILYGIFPRKFWGHMLRSGLATPYVAIGVLVYIYTVVHGQSSRS